jgi:uncharacterized protein (TIGR00375 family)
MNLETLSEWANKKGLQILGTGDFTHPGWYAELKNKLEEKKPGLFQLKNINNKDKYFMLTSEVSCIYSKNGKVRKIHNLIFSPSLEAVKKINDKLSKVGNLWADGRPIFGLDSKILLKIIKEADPDNFLVPAHIWTPWFSLFGSMSGFDTIEECFDELTPEIFACETGLSSDPEMNWRLSQLDKITLISNSDCHSPANLAREANVFEISEDKLSFQEIRRILKEKDIASFPYTIEFFPEEGKYHYDGHRNCNVSLSPTETKKLNNICPKCGRKLTIGVAYRVDDLADRPEGYKLKNQPATKHLIPLAEIIAEDFGTAKLSKKVIAEYDKIVNHIGSEMNVLLDASAEDLGKITSMKIAKDVEKMRTGQVEKIPGYDGVFGIIKVKSSNEEKKEDVVEQKSLF